MERHLSEMTAGRIEPKRTVNYREIVNQAALHFALIFILFLAMIPIIIMIIISFKDRVQYLLNPIGLTFPLHFKNYYSAGSVVLKPLGWTLLIAFLGITFNLFTSSMAAYALARYKFLASKLMYYMIFGLMFIPTMVVLVPLYLWNKQLGLANIWGLFFTYWILGHPFSVFLLTNSFRSISEELLEAARCDGAGHTVIWSKIVLPLARPMVLALGVMQFLWIYSNDYMWQLVMVGASPAKTVSVAVAGLRQGFVGGLTDVGTEMAGYVITSLPLIIAFLLASKVFIRGMTAGAIKG